MVADTHYYDILGLNPAATSGMVRLSLSVLLYSSIMEYSAEIKRAYKKKALQSHPVSLPKATRVRD
jgi:curved DNA-binding protein CbpA